MNCSIAPLINTIVFVFLTISVALGQGNSFLNYSVEEGLPSAETYQIYKDRQGFLWIATDNGVVKYDGGEFKVYNVDDGLLDPVVFSFHEDNRGRIWFRTFTGKLSYWYNDKIYSYKYNDSITNYTKLATINNIYNDTQNNLWISVSNNLIKIDSTGNVVVKKTYGKVLELHPIEKELLFTLGYNAANTDTLIYNNKRFPFIKSAFKRSYEILRLVNWHGKQYFAYNRGIYYIDDQGIKQVFSSPKIIISLLVDADNKLWAGYMNEGLSYFNKPDFKDPVFIEELSDKSITSIVQDEQRGYWISTLEKGIYHFPNFSIKRSPIHTHTKITSAKTNQDHVITTDYSGVITAIDTANLNIVWEQNLGYPILSAYSASDSRLWINTVEKNYILDSNGYIKKSILTNGIITLAEYNKMIYSVTNYGYHQFDLNGNLVNIFPVQYHTRNLLIKDSKVYIGGKNGLSINDLNFKRIKEIKELEDIKIIGLTDLTDSILFVSTVGNGFILLNTETLTCKFYNRSSNFIADNIYSVVKNDTSVFIGTERGVAFTRITDLALNNPKFKFIKQRTGLPSSKVNHLVMTNDRLWVFGENEFVTIPLNKITYANNNPRPYIKEFRVNNTIRNISDGNELSANENDIHIELGFLSFTNQNVFTRYKLSNKDEWRYKSDWNYDFNSLSPGDYSMQIEYSIDNLNWQPTNLDLTFSINQPWWRTWYFFAGAAISLLMIGLFFYNSRINEYKERDRYLNVINDQQKKLLTAEIEATERERTRIANDLHDGISIDLISMKLMLNRVAKNMENEEVKDMDSLLQKTIVGIKNIIYGLTPPGVDFFGLSAGVQSLINLIKNRSSVSIKYKYQGEELRDPNTGGLIFRIIQEIINNSLKHSMCDEITLDITSTNELISIFYTDNGQGFDFNNVKRGLGLNSIQSRIDLLGGRMDVKSDKGVTYFITIPLVNYRRLQQTS